MFGLFRKDHKEKSTNLAKSAAISPVYEKGNYCAFLISRPLNNPNPLIGRENKRITGDYFDHKC